MTALARTTIAQRYELKSVLGAGGMGVAWLARDHATANTVVVKFVRDVSALGSARRFERECAAIAALDHPAIVTYVEHGVDPTFGLFLVTEWIAGETLAQRVRSEELSVLDALVLAERVADGLAHAHARAIVHRDVSPSNIVLCDGSIARPKLIDFGVASARAGADAPSEAGQIVGTIAYMAPEQARSEPSIDARADVFALGAVLYRLVARSAMRDTSDPLRALARAGRLPAPKLASELDVDASVRAVIERATAFAPEDRFRDAGELRAALRDAIDEARSARATTHASAGARREALVMVVASEDRAALDAISRALRALGATIESAARLVRVTVDEGAERSTIESAIELARSACERSGESTRGAGAIVDPSRESLDDAMMFAEESLPELGAFSLRDASGVLAQSEPRSSAPAMRPKAARFVGRSREFERLERAWIEARATNTRRSVLVTAHAGLGKSRLAEELARELAASHRASVTTASALPEHRDEPLRFARRIVNALDEDRSTIASSVPLPRAELVAHLARALSSPRALVLDDVQWSDPASLAVIDGALRSVSRGGSLVVVLGRPELLSPDCGLRATRFDEQIVLSPLDDGACARIARSAAAPLSAELVQMCIERAGGSPLRLLELLRSDVATIELARQAPDFRGLVRKRIDELPPDARALAVAIAAVGLTCARAEAIVAAESDDHLVDRALATLVDEGWLRERDDTYAFDHPTTREILYASASEAQRCAVHRRVFQWLVREQPDACARIVAHGSLAGLDQELPRFEAEWCRQLLDAGDFDEVLACANRSFARRRVRDPELDLLVAIAAPFSARPRDGIEAALRCLEAFPTHDERRWRAISALFRGCHRTLDRAPIADAERWFEDADPRAPAVIEAALEWTYTIGPWPSDDPRLVWTSRARALFDAPLTLLAIADAVDARFAFANTDSLASIAHWRRARAQFLAAGQHARAAVALANEANSYFNVGKIDEVEPLVSSTLEAAGSLPPRCESHLLMVLAFAHLLRREYPRAVSHARASIELCERSDDRRMAGEAHLVCAYALRANGEPTLSLESARRAAELFSPTIDRYVCAMVALADALTALGRRDEARRVVSELAWSKAMREGSEVDVAHFAVVLCELLVDGDEQVLAHERYREAGVIIDKLAAPLAPAQRAEFEQSIFNSRFYALGRARGWR